MRWRSSSYNHKYKKPIFVLRNSVRRNMMPRPKVRETGNEYMDDDALYRRLLHLEEELVTLVKKYRPNFMSTVTPEKLAQMTYQQLRDIDKKVKERES